MEYVLKLPKSFYPIPTEDEVPVKINVKQVSGRS